MLVIWAFEFTVVSGLVLLFLTQVVWPAWKGTPMFPVFRRQRKLEAEIGLAKEGTVEARLEREVANERARTERIRAQRQGAQSVPPPVVPQGEDGTEN